MVTRLRISLLTGILVGLTLATPALSSHFRGAIISWRAVNSSEFDGRVSLYVVYSSDYLNYNILGLVAGTALISSEEVVL